MRKLIAYFEGAAKELRASIKEAEVSRTKIPTYLVDAQINAALILAECHHQCMSNCRREGCNCECGEFHDND